MLTNFQQAQKKVGAFKLDGGIYIPNGENSHYFKGLTNIEFYIVVTPDNLTHFRYCFPSGLGKAKILESSATKSRRYIDNYEVSRNPNLCIDLDRILRNKKTNLRLLNFFSVLRELPLDGTPFSAQDAYMLMHAVAPGMPPDYMRMNGKQIEVGYREGIGKGLGRDGVHLQLFNNALSKLKLQLMLHTGHQRNFDSNHPTFEYAEDELRHISRYK